MVIDVKKGEKGNIGACKYTLSSLNIYTWLRDEHAYRQY